MDFETLQSRGFLLDGAPLRPQASYDAASQGRRLKDWAPGSPGPTRAAVGQMSTVRARSRDAGRNNGWIANGVRNWVSNEVGAGIKPRSKAPDATFAAEANRLWDEEFCAAADYDGTLDAYGLMALAVRSRKEAGEVFVRIRHLGLNSGAPVPVQFQLIESEQVPHTHSMQYGDREIVAGIEFDGNGKRSQYWMYRRHPCDMSPNGMELVPVPASEVIHHFAPLRPGQVRGIAETVQALIKARDFDEYDDAELTRKKTRANYTGAITRQSFDDSDFQFDPFTGEPLEGGAAPMVNIEPGTFPALLPGEEIKLFDADQGGAYGEFMRQQLMGVAASLGIPYELLSGDMRNVNDRILRALLNEYRRLIEQAQWLYTIPQLCRRIWEAFIDAAVLAGRLKARDYATNRKAYLACDWRPQAWRYLHPVQDAQGELMLIKGGLSSRAAAAAERGYDVEDIDRQNQADTERAQAMGLQYSHDPVKVTDE